MKKFLLTLAFFALCAGFLAAQSRFSVRGKINDEKGEPLPGAVVLLERPRPGAPTRNTLSGADGAFVFNDLRGGPFVLKISFLGFENFQKNIALEGADLDLGTLVLQPTSVQLGETLVKETMVTAVQKDDTTQFNAGAFKVMRDASAQDLVEKIPGVTVENGQLKTQGENVQQVLVDGKPFFGNDPAAALKNLPAEVIDKIQVFDAQSEQAQFTGFSDGNALKTINIVTKTSARQGQFGKIYAGYGHRDKYQAGGNINFFDGARRVALIGMSNNINVQNFSSDDILGVLGSSGGNNRGQGNRGGGQGGGRGGQGGGQGGWRGNDASGDFLVQTRGGIAKTHAFGLNYSDKWGKKIEATASYFFNKSINTASSDLARQFLNGDTENQIYTENSLAISDNLNHRFNARVEWKPDSLNSLLIRPRLTVQENDGRSDILGQTDRSTDPLNATENRWISDLRGLNFSNSLLWRHRFPKRGRTFSVEVTNGFSPKTGNSKLLSVSDFYVPPPVRRDSLDQKSVLDLNSWNAGGNLEWTEPVGKNGQISLNYRLNLQQDDSDKRSFDLDPISGAYSTANLPLSNVFSNDFNTQQAGAGYNYNKGRDLTISARLNAQWANLAGEQSFPGSLTAKRDFFNWLPFAMLRWNLDKDHSARVFYRSSTQLPSVQQLQNVVDNSNPLQLSAGNPDLRQSENHNLFMRWQSANPARSTNFFAMLSGGFTKSYIANSTFLADSDNPIFADLDVQPGAQLTLPVNLDGYRNARAFASYGFPLKKIKSNLNLDAAWNFSRTPGLVEEALNFVSSHNLGAGASLTSNVSEKLDFTVSLRPSWTSATNTLQTAANTQFLAQNSRMKLNWQIIKGFVLRTDLTHTLNTGLSDGFNQNFWLWNAAIGKQVFKNKRGEIALSMNDILNQNRDIRRTVTEIYIEDTRTNALTRFLMLSFTYNLRHFKTGKKVPEQPAETDRPRW